MAGVRRWIRLDINWEDSAWLDALDGVAAGCWPRLLCMVKRDGVGGRCKRPDPVVLARRWRVTRDAVTSLERAAIEHGSLLLEDGDWVVVKWAEYQDTDPTATERKRRQREKQKQEHELPDSPQPPATSRASRRDNRDNPGRLSRATETETETETTTETPSEPSGSEGGAGRRQRKARKPRPAAPRHDLPASEGEYHAELAPVIREAWWETNSDRPPAVLAIGEGGSAWTMGRELDIAKRLASEHKLTPAEMGEVLRSARTLVDLPAGPVSLRIFAMNGRRDLFNRVLHELTKQQAYRSTENGAARASEALRRIGLELDDGD